MARQPQTIQIRIVDRLQSGLKISPNLARASLALSLILSVKPFGGRGERGLKGELEANRVGPLLLAGLSAVSSVCDLEGGGSWRVDSKGKVSVVTDGRSIDDLS